jgi:hypothetical protein
LAKVKESASHEGGPSKDTVLLIFAAQWFWPEADFLPPYHPELCCLSFPCTYPKSCPVSPCRFAPWKTKDRLKEIGIR